MTALLQKALDYAQPVLIPLVVGMIVQFIRYLSAKLKLTLTETQQQQLKFALEQGVAAAAERYRSNPGVGQVKAAFALDQAKRLAPDAMKKVAPEQQKVLVQATYAKLRPSLPNPSTFSMGGSDIPVDVVDFAEAPARMTPIPPPKRAP